MDEIKRHFEQGSNLQQELKNSSPITQESSPYRLSSDELIEGIQRADAVTGKEMASLAGRVLRSKNPVPIEDSQRLAGSVLRQYIANIQAGNNKFLSGKD